MMSAEMKKEMRAQVIAKREALSGPDRLVKSEIICQTLLKAFNADIDGDRMAVLDNLTIAVYQSIKSEVELDAFIRGAYARGAQLVFPCMTKKEVLFSSDALRMATNQGKTARQEKQKIMKSYMVFRVVSRDSYTALVKGPAYTSALAAPFVENPLHSFALDDSALEAFPLVEAHEIDIVIVPLVAFDHKGNRLGYGGGNYDRFLEEVSLHTQVIGVAFAEQEVESVPTESYDKVLSRIISA